MPLIDDLIVAGKTIPPSHLPNVADVAGVVAALAAHIQHGNSFLAAAEKGADAVAELLATEQAKQEAESAAPAPTADAAPAATDAAAPSATGEAPTYAELVAELQQLRAQVAARDPATVS